MGYHLKEPPRLRRTRVDPIMNMIIRKAQIGDLRTIQDLNHALFESDHSSDRDLKMTWPYDEGESYFRGMIEGTIGVCFVAVENEEVIGYLAGCIKTDTPSWRPIIVAELENMLVRSEYRSRGVGAALADNFITWSKDNGAQRIAVSAYSKNQRAIDFYKSLGFDTYCTELELDLTK